MFFFLKHKQVHWNDQLKSHLFLQIHVLLLVLISLIDCCLEMCCFENCCLPLNNKLIDRYLFPCLSFIYINLVGGIRWSTTRNFLSIIERRGYYLSSPTFSLLNHKIRVSPFWKLQSRKKLMEQKKNQAKLERAKRFWHLFLRKF